MFNETIGKYEGYIYQIYNPFNMKSYIGQTIQGVHKRMIQHKTASRRHPSDSIYLYTDANNYGWDIFNVYIVETVECDSNIELRQSLNDKEIFYIQSYNSLYPNGYNIAKGGDVLPNTYEECSVYKFDLDGNLLTSYESMSDAARINSISQADISHCCNGEKVATVGGFYWSKNPVLVLKSEVKKKNTRVDMYSKTGEFIKTFDSTVGAALEVYGDKKFKYYIKNGLKSGKPAGGYIWKYHEKR